MSRAFPGCYHFELVNLGYGAYLGLYELYRQEFPDISDQAIAKMVSGLDVVLRPDDELRRLAERAVELGLAEDIKSARREEELIGALADTGGGDRWLADYREAKDPWFCFSYGNGLYHHHGSWSDDPSLPVAMIGSYAARLQAGEDIRRPQHAVLAERDRITDAHRALLPKESRGAFNAQLELARTVFPHIEDHNFYIDHWSQTVLWNKVREFGALLAGHAFLADPEDVFFLRHGEVRSALRGTATRVELWRRRGPSRPQLVAPHRRAPQTGFRGAPSVGSAPGAGPGTRRCDRAGHDHALGNHHRARAGVAPDIGRHRERHDTRDRGPSRSCRGTRASDP